MFFFLSVENKPNVKTGGSQWLLANINLVGYYRVNYDDGNWEKLLNALRATHTVRNIVAFIYQCPSRVNMITMRFLVVGVTKKKKKRLYFSKRTSH